MKRRKFIVKSAVGGLVLGFIPAHVFSIENTEYEPFHFPKISGQIRHGMYSPEIKNHIHVDEFITYLEKHVFFKNGFEKGESDLINLSFRFKDKLHSFSWFSDKIHYQDEEYYSEVNRIIAISDTKPSIAAIQLKGKLQLNIDHEVIVIPLNSKCHVNQISLDEQKGLIVRAGEVNLESKKEVKLVLMSRNYG